MMHCLLVTEWVIMLLPATWRIHCLWMLRTGYSKEHLQLFALIACKQNMQIKWEPRRRTTTTREWICEYFSEKAKMTKHSKELTSRHEECKQLWNVSEDTRTRYETDSGHRCWNRSINFLSLMVSAIKRYSADVPFFFPGSMIIRFHSINMERTGITWKCDYTCWEHNNPVIRDNENSSWCFSLWRGGVRGPVPLLSGVWTFRPEQRFPWTPIQQACNRSVKLMMLKTERNLITVMNKK